MIHDLLPEGTDGEIWTAGRIRRRRIVGAFLRQRTPFIDPFLPSTIHNAAILMSIHLEDPERIASPPVIPVTVEHDGMIVPNALATHEFSEGFLIDIVAHHLVLQFVMPVYFHGPRDMSNVI